MFIDKRYKLVNVENNMYFQMIYGFNDNSYTHQKYIALQKHH